MASKRPAHTGPRQCGVRYPGKSPGRGRLPPRSKCRCTAAGPCSRSRRRIRFGDASDHACRAAETGSSPCPAVVRCVGPPDGRPGTAANRTIPTRHWPTAPSRLSRRPRGSRAHPRFQTNWPSRSPGLGKPLPRGCNMLESCSRPSGTRPRAAAPADFARAGVQAIAV